MDQRIIYQNDEGGVAVIIPADCGLTIEQIADKDVPTDRQWRAEWTVDEADLTDGVGA